MRRLPLFEYQGGLPGGGSIDDRLPLATAVPVWGMLSMLGWLSLAWVALFLLELPALAAG